MVGFCFKLIEPNLRLCDKINCSAICFFYRFYLITSNFLLSCVFEPDRLML